MSHSVLKVFLWEILYIFMIWFAYFVEGFEFAVLVSIILLPLIIIVMILTLTLGILEKINKRMEKEMEE